MKRVVVAIDGRSAGPEAEQRRVAWVAPRR